MAQQKKRYNASHVAAGIGGALIGDIATTRVLTRTARWLRHRRSAKRRAAINRQPVRVMKRTASRIGSALRRAGMRMHQSPMARRVIRTLW